MRSQFSTLAAITLTACLLFDTAAAQCIDDMLCEKELADMISNRPKGSLGFGTDQRDALGSMNGQLALLQDHIVNAPVLIYRKGHLFCSISDAALSKQLAKELAGKPNRRELVRASNAETLNFLSDMLDDYTPHEFPFSSCEISLNDSVLAILIIRRFSEPAMISVKRRGDDQKLLVPLVNPAAIEMVQRKLERLLSWHLVSGGAILALGRRHALGLTGDALVMYDLDAEIATKPTDLAKANQIVATWPSTRRRTLLGETIHDFTSLEEFREFCSAALVTDPIKRNPVFDFFWKG